MYSYISGPLAEITPSYAVIDCSGVGYQLEITLTTYTEIKDQKEVKLWVHEVVREDAHLLYGFGDTMERDMFRLLIDISGVGPSTARMMLSSLTVGELQEAVTSQNVKRVQSVKGIGAKTAQRIVLELQDKMGGVKAAQMGLPGVTAVNQNMEEAQSALVMLGFPKPNVEKVLQGLAKVLPGDATVEELIKEALKKL